ncbi:hypothetical protein C8R43DRAFT_994126 [Mycena crocata]|nr:hypothetical protein C8R43DRAFT_994126 [Mycena crocata]
MNTDASSEQTDSDAPTRVDGLWFTQKETLVIRAENKIFQIYPGILAARSSVFRDMIAFPQPPSGTEQIDGSPVVHLSDSAQDVEAFLRAIYDSSYFMPTPAAIELSVVLGILHLSHKYDVQYLHHRALEHLTVDGWYAPTCDERRGDPHLINNTPSPPLKSLSVINAASEVGALWLLPLAYYYASTFSCVELAPFLVGPMSQPARKAMAAREHLLRGTVAINRFLSMHNPSGACKTSHTCTASRNTYLARLYDDIDQVADLIPLEDWNEARWSRFKAKGVCEDCYSFARASQLAAVSAFWDKLPSFFDLPPWEDLHGMKRAALGEEANEQMAD